MTPQQQYARQQAINNGRAAERATNFYVKGSLATNQALQNKDIDVVGRRYDKTLGKWIDVTYSVKDCKKTCKRVGPDKASLPIENKLINSRDREDWIGGCFIKCEADWNVFRVWIDGREKGDEDQLLFVKHQFLCNWLREHAKEYRRVNLVDEQIENNRKQGRRYDDSEVILIPLKIVLDQWLEGKDYFLRKYVVVKGA